MSATHAAQVRSFKLAIYQTIRNPLQALSQCDECQLRCTSFLGKHALATEYIA